MALTAKQFTTDATPQGRARCQQAADGQRPLKRGETSDGVKALQSALIAAGESIPDGATGFFGSQTQAAVFSFQGKHRAEHGTPDGEAGKITMRLLNTKLGGDDPGPTPPQPPPPPPAPKILTDYVIFFDGGGPGETVADDEVFNTAGLPEDYGKSRELVRLGWRTGLIDGGSTLKKIDEFKARIQASKTAGTLGRVFVYGASGGGRVAINFVKQLNGAAITPRYLGVTDPAFFEEDSTNHPKSFDDTLPIFRGTGTSAEIKHNYYQKAGNRVRLKPKEILNLNLTYMWWSTMRNNEIHGKIQDFSNPDQDLTSLVARKVRPRSLNPDLHFHSACNEIATDKMRAFIRNELK